MERVVAGVPLRSLSVTRRHGSTFSDKLAAISGGVQCSDVQRSDDRRFRPSAYPSDEAPREASSRASGRIEMD